MIDNSFGRIASVAAAAAAAALIVSAAVPASAALADPTDAKASRQADEQPAGKQKRYCVETPTTGTILPTRICKTRAEWIKHDGFDPTLQQDK